MREDHSISRYLRLFKLVMCPQFSKQSLLTFSSAALCSLIWVDKER